MPEDADFVSVLRYSLAIAGVVISLSLALLLFFWRGFFKEKANVTLMESRTGERMHIRNLALLIGVVMAACTLVFWVALAD